MQEESTEKNAPAEARRRGPAIQFQDSKGQVWRVSERERLRYDRRTVKMLVFESSTAIRCVREYPEDWRDLASEALEYLSWKV